MHAYLLFRGQDIKDLHVHEKAEEAAQEAKGDDDKREADGAADTKDDAPDNNSSKESKKEDEQQQQLSDDKKKKNTKPQRKNMVGTGASLLNKNMRGGKGDTGAYILIILD